MGITSDEATKILNEIIEEGWLISDMEKCDAIDACEFAIDKIHKYQQIEQIYQKYNEVNDFSYNQAMSEEIGKVLNVRNSVKIGDEIYSGMTETKAVVYHIDAWHRYDCFTEDGCSMCLDEHTFNEYWTRTGRNFPQIEAVLRLVKGEKDV